MCVLRNSSSMEGKLGYLGQELNMKPFLPDMVLETWFLNVLLASFKK